jgi:magnesium chelatase family protein
VRARSVSLLGLNGIAVDVEADVSSGLPAIRLVGLADRAVNEAIDRVRSAVANSALAFPSQRLTVSLSPAALPKSGSAFDLPIAIACLAAMGVIPPATREATVFIGELALDGRLRPTAGILPSVLAARQLGATRVVVPSANADEARLVSGITVVGVASLREAAQVSGADIDVFDLEPLRHARTLTDGDAGSPAATSATSTPSPPAAPDLSDIIGLDSAIEALIVAATGGHNIFMVGPPGAGKTMLASRLPGILPPLDEEHALEVATIRSLVEGSRREVNLATTPPFQAPHHSLSAAGMVGGGPGVVRPGVATQAHRGVLFLDEAPEFATNVLDSLRQPLESGKLSLQRAAYSVDFPSDFQLVLAANPCPCGQSSSSNDVKCTCTPVQRLRYLSRLSGPLMDRVDIHLTVPRATTVIRDELTTVTCTADARARVQAARDIALTRWGGMCNARVPGSLLRSAGFRLPRAVTTAIDESLHRRGITMRGYDRVLRLAWSLADLDETTTPNADHIGRALFLRKGILQ